MPKARYSYVFSITGQDEINFQTARGQFKVIEIVRLGIKEALKQCPKPPKDLINKVRI